MRPAAPQPAPARPPQPGTAGTDPGKGPAPATMRAVVTDRYGSPDVLRTERIARPAVADDEVLVRVVAAGVDRGTWHLLTGLPYLTRIIGAGVRRPKNPVPGLDLAGTVVAVGPKVTRFVLGDAVFGIGKGSFAEYAAAKESKLAPLPASLTFEQAAAVPVSGLTALQSVRDAAPVSAGQKVLVLGAAGGVGSYAVQLAKARGAHVTGVCSAAKADFVRSLGADRILDYRRDDITADGPIYDVVVDTGGNRSLRTLRRALNPRGSLVVVGGEGGGRWTGGFGRNLRAPLLSPFVRQRLRSLISSENADDLAELATLADQGAFTPAVWRTYPLEQAADALADLEAGRVAGKVVLTV